MSFKTVILSVVALQVYTATALPPCVCTRNLKPVCGSDGVEYANECLLQCEQHKGNTDLTVAKQGPCQPMPTCFCTYEYKPVCGSDGKSYPNKCALGCEASTKNIELVSEGECPPKEPPCICTDELDLVCGTDGNTYPNPCNLNCATAKNPMLGIKHKGTCDNSVRVVDP